MNIGNVVNNIQVQTSSVELKQQEQVRQRPISERVETQSGYALTQPEKAILKAIEAANKKLDGEVREFKFAAIHEQTKQIMVKVIDTATKEVVRELPPEKILDMVANMCEVAGLFVDEKR